MGPIARLCTVVAILATAGISAPVRAESSVEKAERLVREGLKDARQKKFGDARDKFQTAVQLNPLPVYMHNLGRALQKLNDPAQAHRWFSQALKENSEYKFASDARKHLKNIEKLLKKTHALVRVQSTPSVVPCTITTSDGKREVLINTPFQRWVPAGPLKIEGRVERYIDGKVDVTVAPGENRTVKIRLEPQPVEGFLEVLTDVPNAEVFVNGKTVGTAPLKNHVVTTGSYSIEVRAEGYKVFKKTVVVEPDATERVVARLDKISQASVDKDEADMTLGYVLVGGGAGLVITGAVLVGLAVSKVPATGIPEGPTGDALVDEIRGFEIGGYACLGVGAVMAGVGIYLLLSQDPESGDTAQLQLPPFMPTFSVDSDSASAGARISF